LRRFWHMICFIPPMRCPGPARSSATPQAT